MKLRILHFFCGCGGSGLGATAAESRIGGDLATFETVGGIDIDQQACRDFERLVGAPSLCIDVHDLEPEQLRTFAGDVAPDVVMMSPPCKGFSGLLSAKRAAEPKYQRMNQLMIRSLFLVCEAWTTPPKIIFVENVPRIASRGKDMTRQSRALLEAHGFAVAEGNHDCGELGSLAQHRRRYFMLARHRAAVPQMVYQPATQRVRACGEVLGPLPMPGDVEAAGPMHSVPKLSWRNWKRLALIPAGGDWRDLPGTLDEGQKRRAKFRRAPVTAWDATSETVTGPGGSASSAVADPRIDPLTGNKPAWQRVAGVTPWSEPSPTVTSGAKIHAGAFQVADPRVTGHASRYRIMTLAEALAITDEELPPDRAPPWIPMIIAGDGTWHRPLTTLELAVLQSFPHEIDGMPLVLAGTSHTRWREAIGNAVPPLAALKVAEQLARALHLAALGMFALDSNLVWVAPESAVAS